MDKIANELAAIVEREVSRRLGDDETWHERYEFLRARLEQMRDEAQQLFDDMRANGLTANTIEAEGYLRGCIQAANLLDA